MQPLKQEKYQIIFSPNLTYDIVETWDIAYFLPG